MHCLFDYVSSEKMCSLSTSICLTNFLRPNSIFELTSAQPRLWSSSTSGLFIITSMAFRLRKVQSCQELSTCRNPQEPQLQHGQLLRLRVLQASSKTLCYVTAEIVKCFLPYTQSQGKCIGGHTNTNTSLNMDVLKDYADDTVTYSHGSSSTLSCPELKRLLCTETFPPSSSSDPP